MNVLSHKKKIRLQVKQATQLLSETEIRAQSDNVWAKLEQLPEFKTAKNILCYWSFAFEVETHQFIMRTYGHKTIYLPKVAGKNLTLHKFNGADSLQRSSYGIMEPVGNELANLEAVDFVVVPGVAFSTNGKRLGRGGGYYDGLLPKLTNALKVGVGFNVQLLDDVPCEAHDVVLDKVITAER